VRAATHSAVCTGLTRRRRGISRARIAGSLIRAGTAAFVIGLSVGLGLLFDYSRTASTAVCVGDVARRGVLQAWPWALPWVAAQGVAFASIALGLWLVGRDATRRCNERIAR
jgi:hypothetical protein